MYSLLIADDELIILRGLRKLLNWAELDIEIIGEANDGLEAREMIISLKPDFAILDICMPLCSGVEILKTVYEKKLKTQVIFLSGHEEFTYAREAIKYGALSYLVKPVRKKELLQVIKSAIEKVDSKTSTKIAMDRLIELEQNPFIKSNGLDRPLSTALAIQVQGIEQMDHDMERLVLFSILRTIERRLTEKKMGVAFSKQGMIFVLLNHDEDHDPQNLTLNLIEYIFRNTGKDMIVGIGNTVESIKDINQSIRNARDALNYRFIRPDEKMHLYTTPIEENIEYQVNKQIKQITSYISANFTENITLESTAKMVYMNPYYFSSYFKKHTGTNFKDYLTKIRMEKAVEILRTENVKTYQLAEMVGFGDAKYFSELFKRTYGMTPKEFRQYKKL